jgi:hypothetical protein
VACLHLVLFAVVCSSSNDAYSMQCCSTVAAAQSMPALGGNFGHPSPSVAAIDTVHAARCVARGFQQQ